MSFFLFIFSLFGFFMILFTFVIMVIIYSTNIVIMSMKSIQLGDVYDQDDKKLAAGDDDFVP